MEIVQNTMPYASGVPFRLAMFADLHVGSSQFARRRFKAWLAEEAAKPNTWFMANGDMWDALVPVDLRRFRMSAIDPHYLRDSVNVDNVVDKQLWDFIEMVDPYKHQFIGMGRGNHEDKLLKHFGVDLISTACKVLGIRDLGYSSLIRLKFRYHTGQSRTRRVNIFAHHGFGGSGRGLSGDVNKYFLSTVPYYPNNHLYVLSHTHRKWSHCFTQVDTDSADNWRDREMWLVNPGSFRVTMSPGVIPSYEETSLYPPTIIGGMVMEINLDGNYPVMRPVG